tara:strand:+ start:135 stop:800 length:666 start_codon:yes stop_codon:yes gene_type:complete
MDEKLHALIIGATGATGKELVKELLNNSNFSKISVFGRRVPDIESKKLFKYKIDFSELDKIKKLLSGDILFSVLGTTLKQAGGKKNQFLVDYTYQYEFAKTAVENGTKKYSLVSSTGADKNSFFFYPKIKGELEESVKKLPFNKIQIFQPPTLIRQPALARKGEKIGIKVFNKLNKIGFLKSQKPLPVKILARIMIDAALSKNSDRIEIFSTQYIAQLNKK